MSAQTVRDLLELTPIVGSENLRAERAPCHAAAEIGFDRGGELKPTDPLVHIIDVCPPTLSMTASDLGVDCLLRQGVSEAHSKLSKGEEGRHW